MFGLETVWSRYKEPGVFEAVDGAIYNADPQYTSRLYLSDGGVPLLTAPN